jgi:hypothetical protein
MNLVNLIFKQIKKNSKTFIIVNFIFFIFLFYIFNHNHNQNKKLNKNNYRIILKYDKNIYLDRFDITSFAQKPLYQIINKNTIYLEQKKNLQDRDLYYLYIINDNSSNSDKLFKNYFLQFKESYLNLINSLIADLKLSINNNQDTLNNIFFLDIADEITINEYNLYKNQLKKDLDKLKKLEMESFEYEVLDSISYDKFISINHDKLSFIIFFFLTVNFLVIFNRK